MKWRENSPKPRPFLVLPSIVTSTEDEGMKTPPLKLFTRTWRLSRDGSPSLDNSKSEDGAREKPKGKDRKEEKLEGSEETAIGKKQKLEGKKQKLEGRNDVIDVYKTKKHRRGKRSKDLEFNRPLTATLERPLILNIRLLGKVDMSLIRKELLTLTNLCRFPLTMVKVHSKKSVNDRRIQVATAKKRSASTRSSSSSMESPYCKDYENFPRKPRKSASISPRSNHHPSKIISLSPKNSTTSSPSPKSWSSSPKDSKANSLSSKDCKVISLSPKDCKVSSLSPKDCTVISLSPKDSKVSSPISKSSRVASISPKNSRVSPISPKNSKFLSSTPKGLTFLSTTPKQEEMPPQKISLEDTSRQPKNIFGPKSIDDPNNNRIPPAGKTFKISKLPPSDKNSHGVASIKLPEPCRTCGRSDQPERFHSHPSGKQQKKENLKVPLAKTSVQKPVAIKYKSSLDQGKQGKSGQGERLGTPNKIPHLDKDSDRAESPRPKSGRCKMLVCYLCGREFGTASLPLHEPKCLQVSISHVLDR